MDLTFIPLENPFIRLEPLENRHRDALRDLANDPDLWMHTSLNAAIDFDGWFDTMMASNTKGVQMSYAVCDKLSHRECGHTSFLSLSPENQRVEIGWTWYGRVFHGGHVNPACKLRLMEHAFSCGAERVELKTRGENLRSQRAMEKMGAKRDGVLRSHARTWTGERRDSVFYSVLLEEWPDVKSGLEQRLEAFGQ